jgi:4-carboxymuconolactone decarboxylase
VSDEQYNATPSTFGERAPASSPQSASASQTSSSAAAPDAERPSGPVQQRVAPGMAALTDEVLYGDVWRRPELSLRDRGLVTIAALIAMGKTAPLPGHLGRALDNGLQPREASGLLAHLAVYCGWPSAVAALDAYDQVYTARKIDRTDLGPIGPASPISSSDSARAKVLTEELGAAAPKLAQLTNEVVFGDLWRRTDLSVRDRSLITIVALAAMGDDDQLDAYVRRGVESGLTRDQVVEAITHLAFYAGWNRATSAMVAVANTFGK